MLKFKRKFWRLKVKCALLIASASNGVALPSVPAILLVATVSSFLVKASWNVMTLAQKPDFVFRRNGRVHLNRRGRQFGRLLAAELCASEVVMLDMTCSGVEWRVLATHSIRQFPLHFPSGASPCAIIFQLESNSCWYGSGIRVWLPSFFVCKIKLLTNRRWRCLQRACYS